MSSTLYVAGTKNFLQKALNGAINDSVQTITLNNTTNMQAPGYIVIDRVNSAGVATPDSREEVSYTGISGNDLTGCTRAADGSTARSHNDAAVVEVSPTSGMWNSLTTVVSQGFTGDGYLKAINSPVSINRGEFVTLAVQSIASIANLQIGDLQRVAITSITSVAQAHISNSYLANVTVTGSLNTSGASINGAFPTANKIITSTRDLTAASGNVAYTGVGFRPTAIICLAAISSVTSGQYSVGVADGSLTEVSLFANDSNNSTTVTRLINIQTGVGAVQDAVVLSLDADGFTLTWTKSGSPSGTANLIFLCFR